MAFYSYANNPVPGAATVHQVSSHTTPDWQIEQMNFDSEDVEVNPLVSLQAAHNAAYLGGT